jgi:hypothetical protein
MKMFFINSVLILLSVSCSTGNPVDGKKLADSTNHSDTVTQKKSDDDTIPFTADDAKKDFEKGNYRMITYGLEAHIASIGDFEDSLLKIYGFHYDNQGCDVYKGSLEGAEEYNSEMDILLQKRNGKYWKNDFDWKLDSATHAYEVKHRNDTE